MKKIELAKFVAEIQNGNIDEISYKILINVPKQNKKYVKKQLDENILDYLFY